MSKSLPYLEPGLQIGDYSLKSLVDSSEFQQVWLGEQISVKREVELVCYYGPNTDDFVADIRVKARVEDDVLGLVYEAFPTDQFIAFARELLPARSLHSIIQDEAQLSPREVNEVIKTVGGELDLLSKKEIAVRPFTAHDIRLSPTLEVRIDNIAKAGPVVDEQSSRDEFTSSLRQLLRIGEPGATRMSTLLDYIQGTETQAPISWQQAREYAKQVEEQLSASTNPHFRNEPVMASHKFRPGVMIAGIIFGLITLVIGIFAFRDNDPEIKLDRVVTIPSGKYPRPNGGTAELAAFKIDANEVTIEQYSLFLTAWQRMDEKERKKLWSKNTPESKTSPRPEGWNDYFPLARSQKSWQGLQMSLDCPVMGLDWWDAQAYAKWKGGRLPTELQWWAATTSTLSAGEKENKWGPTGGPGDMLYDLTGNVSEWAGKFSKNPAFPIESPKPVVLGGSYAKGKKGALSREWLSSPSVRRPDLGFRVTYAVEQ